MRLVQIDHAYINVEMIRVIFPTSRGSRIVMTDGSEIMCDNWPREINDLINPPPPLDDSDIPF